jgi:outer membrane protein TolC
VSESIARLQSLEDQIGIARQALDRSEEALRLSRERRQFDIANVLENIQAEQDLTRARGDYFTVISEFNKAQYSLLKALGRLSAPMAVKAPSQHERGR